MISITSKVIGLLHHGRQDGAIDNEGAHHVFRPQP